jgi:vesicle-associated membrane protein 7
MVLERGEKLELLVDKTDQLQSQAFQFNKSSRKLKDAMWWKKVKIYALIAFVVCLVIWIISMIACGGPAYNNCKSDDKSSSSSSSSGTSNDDDNSSNQTRRLFEWLPLSNSL